MSEAGTVKAVLFDWDGTLANSKAAILQSYRDATTEILGRRFPDTPEEVERVMPLRAQESFGALSDDPSVVERLIEGYHQAYLRNSESLSHVFDNVVSTLEELRDRGITLGVVTTKWKNRLDADKARYGMEDLFEVSITGDVSVEYKPHPGPVLDAMKALDVSAAETIYVGDGPHDAIAGVKAGATTVLCTYGFHQRSETTQVEPHYVIDDITEMVGIVDSLNGR